MIDKQSSTQPAVEFRHVSLGFDGLRVLDDVSFQLRRGRLLFMTGASGSGKSVLLRLAAGLLRPDEGEVFIDGREIETLDETELLAIRGGSMGIVFQEESLFTGLTVYDNVAFRPRDHGWSEEATERAVREVLGFVGLENDAEKSPDELSGGMKRRLEIARAMIGWPSIMLYDEPTSGLDPITAVQILDLVMQARDIHGISSIYVTKRLYEMPYLAGHFASRDETGAIIIRETNAEGAEVILLDEGKVAWTGSPSEFAASDLAVVRRMTHAENGTRHSDFYVQDPWSKTRHPKEEFL